MILLLSKLAYLIPLPVLMLFARSFAYLWFYLIPIRRGVAIENIRRAFPQKSRREVSRIALGAFENLCMYAVEALRLPHLTPQTSEKLVQRAPSFSTYHKALAEGRGVIIPTLHLGNWDLFGCSQAIRGEPLHVIVKDIELKSAHDFIFAVRHRCGFQTIPPKKSAAMIREVLKEGRTVAIIGDQHAPPHRGIVTKFFGHWASTSPAVTRFALETGAAIVPAVCVRTDKWGHHKIVMREAFKIEEMPGGRNETLRHNTERLNRIYEEWIKEYPKQWLWLHRRWKVEENRGAYDVPEVQKH